LAVDGAQQKVRLDWQQLCQKEHEINDCLKIIRTELISPCGFVYDQHLA
jgi:hypothetical protein